MLSLVCALALSFPAPPQEPTAPIVAVKAGTMRLVELTGQTGPPVVSELAGGGTILIQGDRILAVGGAELQVPAGARIVDYGPNAVIVPGLVAADSNLGLLRPSDRTADPNLRAVDNFDPYASFANLLSAGVTTIYMAPARGRLIAGQGAVVRLSGESGKSMILSDSAMLHGAVDEEARSTPGYWEPPIPATVDVGIGQAVEQLPRTTMGAIIALRELLALAKGELKTDEYGPLTGPTLAALMKEKKPWRLAVSETGEARALLAFAAENSLPLILDRASYIGDAADEIARAGVPVIVDVPIVPYGGFRDWGKGEEARWPQLDVAARLKNAGVKIAISTPNNVSPRELRFAAAAALEAENGLDERAALRAITLSAAEILGVANDVGTLARGKYADFVVFNGPPLEATSSVVTTWSGGEQAWKASDVMAAPDKDGLRSGAVVLRVEELHVGDGSIQRDVEILLQDGRIAGIAPRVSRPTGAVVVSGFAAMPGIIDGLGFLGLEGSSRVPGPDFMLSKIVEPGDATDRRVAQAGVTAVVLAPRQPSNNGAPLMVYNPAGEGLPADMVLADPAALRVKWTESDRVKSGSAVAALLAKGAEYRSKWDEYEKKLAEWKPPTEEDLAREEAKKKSEESKDEEKKDGEESSEEKKDENGNGDKKEDGAEADVELTATGVWETKITWPGEEEARFRLRLLEHDDGALEGSLRCDSLSTELISLTGTREERTLDLTGLGTKGRVHVKAELPEPEKKDKKKKKKDDEKDEAAKAIELKGTARLGDVSVEFTCERKSAEYVIAKRTERRREKTEPEAEPKGKPKPPRTNNELEPVRRVLAGELPMLVDVSRADEIVACVNLFEGMGVKPILVGADEAWKVLDQIAGKVAGVLPGNNVVRADPKQGMRRWNRYAELVNAGIPVAFSSEAEEGAAGLAMRAAFAVAEGMSPDAALRALTSDVAKLYRVDDKIGTLRSGQHADVLLLDGAPLAPGTRVLRTWVRGREVIAP